MPSRPTRLVAAAALLLVAGCAEQLPIPTEPASSASLSPAPRSSDVSAPWGQIVDGVVGPGTQYRLYMPPAGRWNGELVVYAHGIVAPFFPVSLPAEGDGMAAIFGSQGFAVALSSYKETGLAMKDGTQRTHQLSGIFASKFGKPSRTYLVGSSMGGYIVARLAEQYPKQYDGVMPMCGVVGGFPAEFSYVLAARTMFDLLNPGALPGSPKAVDMPSDLPSAGARVAQIQNAAAAALGANVASGFVIALSDQASMPLPIAAGGPLTNEQFGAFVITPLVLHAIFINDIVQHTHGHFPISNVGVQYSTSSPFAPFILPPGTYAWVNANINRVSADRDALNWVEQNGNTSGDISIPTLTLHTRYDTWVPIQQEAIYRGKVTAAGKGNLLVQRTTEGFDHCNFEPAEIARGLADLVGWVEHGVKPAP